VTQLENNNSFHSQILLYPCHSLNLLLVLEYVVVLAKQVVHNILFEVLEKVDLVQQFIGVFLDGIRLSKIDIAALTSRDIVKVSKLNVRKCVLNENCHLLLVSTQDQSGAVVEINSDSTISQGISHSISVAIIHP